MYIYRYVYMYVYIYRPESQNQWKGNMSPFSGLGFRV
jgi:hypothetical protein